MTSTWYSMLSERWGGRDMSEGPGTAVSQNSFDGGGGWAIE